MSSLCTLCFDKFETELDLVGHDCMGKPVKRSDIEYLMVGVTVTAILTAAMVLRRIADKSEKEGLELSGPQLLRELAQELEIEQKQLQQDAVEKAVEKRARETGT